MLVVHVLVVLAAFVILAPSPPLSPFLSSSPPACRSSRLFIRLLPGTSPEASLDTSPGVNPGTTPGMKPGTAPGTPGSPPLVQPSACGKHVGEEMGKWGHAAVGKKVRQPFQSIRAAMHGEGTPLTTSASFEGCICIGKRMRQFLFLFPSMHGEEMNGKAPRHNF